MQKTNEFIDKRITDTLIIHGNACISTRHFCEKAIGLWNKTHKTKKTRIKVKNLEMYANIKDLDTLKSKEFVMNYISKCEELSNKKLDIRLYPAINQGDQDCVIIYAI